MESLNVIAEKPSRTFGLAPGMWVLIFSALLFSIGALCTKYAGQNVPTSELLFGRGLIGLVIISWILRREGQPFLGNRRWLLALRGFFGFSAFWATMYSYVHLPLGDATVLFYIHPLIVFATSSVFLGEKFGVKGLVCALLSLVGVILVVHPSFIFGGDARLDPMAVVIALLGAVGAAGAYTCIRGLTKTEHPVGIMVYPVLLTVTITPFVGFWQGWVWPSPMEWIALLTLAVVTNAAQFVRILGLSKVPAGRGTAVGYIEIVFAFLWGVSVFSDAVDPLALAGAGLVIACTLVLGK